MTNLGVFLLPLLV